jgi:hypothetical protein
MPVIQDFEVGAIHALSATNKIAILGGFGYDCQW